MAEPDIVFQDDWTTIINGDIFDVMKSGLIPAWSIDMAMTSVPYLRQRRYGDNAMGWEETVDEWLENMHRVSTLVHQALKPSGTYWFNCGDKWGGSSSGSDYGDKRFNPAPSDFEAVKGTKLKKDEVNRKGNLMMLPERVIIRLTDEKLFTLVNKCIWWKRNRSVQSYRRKFVDTYEPVYFMCKGVDDSKYKFNRDKIGVQQRGEMTILSLEESEVQEPAVQLGMAWNQEDKEYWGQKYDEDHAPPYGTPEYTFWYHNTRRKQSWHDHKNDAQDGNRPDRTKSKVLKSPDGANPGDMWDFPIKTDPFFGRNGIPAARVWPSWPLELCTLPILAATDEGDTVFDPFCGSGSLGVAAKQLGRKSVLVDVDRDSCRIAAVRILKAQAPLEGVQGALI